jgi:hypothetical protein
MAVKISSVLLNAGRDDDRISGLVLSTLTPSASQQLFGGQVITQDEAAVPTGAGKTIVPFDGAADVSASNPFPLGLVIESTYPFPGGGVSGDNAAGVGHDTIDYARGGAYSAFHRPGNLVDVYDDKRNTQAVTVNAGQQNTSAPFIQNRTWLVGNEVFAADAALDSTLGRNGLLDNVNAAGAGGARIGIVRAVSGSGSDLILTIELNIAIV